MKCYMLNLLDITISSDLYRDSGLYFKVTALSPRDLLSNLSHYYIYMY